MKRRDRNRNRNQSQPQSPVTKADIARMNGAKSHGPTSEAGKARSSQNAIKHGLCAKKFLGTPSEQAEFNQHLDAAIAHWAPQSDYELYLVTKIARADFQHDRAEDLLVTLINLETGIVGPEIQRAFETMDAAGALALGYKSLNDHSSAHRNLDRHVARLARERRQARKALLEAIDYRQKLTAEQAPIAELEPAPAPQPEPVPPSAAVHDSENKNLQYEPTAGTTVTPINTGRRPVPTAHPVAMQNDPTAPTGGSPNCPAA